MQPDQETLEVLYPVQEAEYPYEHVIKLLFRCCFLSQPDLFKIRLIVHVLCV